MDGYQAGKAIVINTRSDSDEPLLVLQVMTFAINLSSVRHYFTTTGLYFGTSSFITLQPMR